MQTNRDHDRDRDREQRHHAESRRRWRKKHLKNIVINGSIIAVVVALVVFLDYMVSLREEPVVNRDTSGVLDVESSDATVTEPEKELNMVTLPVTVTAATMSDGEVLTLGENCIKKNKELTFVADVEEIGTILLRHGEGSHGSSWLSLDDSKIEVYSFNEEATRQVSEEHGLEIMGKLSIQMNVNANETLELTISSGGKTFTREEIFWTGCKGNIEVESIGNELTNVEVSWNSSDIEKDIWIIGDNYLGSRWKNRWPYYVLEAGYDTMLYTGYPGATSSAMYKEWENLLTYDTPKYAVWCLGMNDGDSTSGINMTWRAKLQLFLSDCDKLGITPILATIPSTPLVNNSYKNEYIRESGYRYIDFAVAVGGSQKNSPWLEGMLSVDQIHPTNAGAEALAERIMKDFPEIMTVEE